jgi:hypothetical protein
VAEQHTLTVKVTGDSSQLVAALNKAQAELAQLDRQSNQTSAGFEGMGRAGGVASGFMESFAGNLASIGFTAAIQGAIQFGTELYNIGRASQVATNTFNQLQGGAEQASASLAMLQEATNFTIPDTTLMSISNLYTQMGLATDPTEVARLAEMGATLGQAMGSSAEEAMRTFSFLLSNQSIELLDTFGISSGKVRERIQDLQKANGDLARDQAFVTAVLEEGALAMERLGDATEQNISAVGKLTTRFQNMLAVMGQDVVGIVEPIAAAMEAGIASSDAFGASVEDIVELSKLFDFAELFPLQDVNALSILLADLVEQTGSFADALTDLENRGMFGRQNELEAFTRQIIEAQKIFQLGALQRQGAIATTGYGFDFAGALVSRQQAEELARLQRQTEAFAEQFANLEDAFDFVSLDLAKGIVSNQELERNKQLLDEINALIFEMLNASVSEDDPTIKTLQKMREELIGLSSDAIRARNEMSLTTALGLGLPPEQRLTADILKMAGIEGRQAEYLTGQRTQLSELFDLNITPLLQGVEAQFSEDEAALLGDRIAKLLKVGIESGLEANPTDLISFVMANAGYTLESGQARSVVVQAGDTLSAIAQREGVSVQLLAEINKLEDPNMILTGSELVVEVGARVTRLLPPLLPTADEIGLDASTLGMIYGGQRMTGEDGEPVTPLGPTAMGIDETLATAQELQTTMSEIVPPVITPAKMGLVAGDVAEVGVVEVIDSIGQKLQDISSRIYQVSMTVNLDANIRTGAGFKIIPITMAELANDISESARIFRLAQGGR